MVMKLPANLCNFYLAFLKKIKYNNKVAHRCLKAKMSWAICKHKANFFYYDKDSVVLKTPIYNTPQNSNFVLVLIVINE